MLFANHLSEKMKLSKSLLKSGKTFTYNHDIVYEIMKDKLNSMNCFEKYKSYTSSTSVPVILRDKVVI